MFEHIFKEKLGDSSGVNGFGARNKDYPLRKAMVNHDQDRIKIGGGRKVCDEVNRELAKGERRRGRDGMERR